ncbi:MAG: hypothetical protein IJ861_08220 [Clostridia bacterium]|nr:hypothetical protein [Clostridia bacterium]
MINPILIIIAAALVLSAFVVALLNKPKFPLVAGMLIVILIFFVFATFLIDSALTELASSEGLSMFVNFLLVGDNPTYEELEAAFNVFMYVDIGLFTASLIAMFAEALFILHKNSDR